MGEPMDELNADMSSCLGEETTDTSPWRMSWDSRHKLAERADLEPFISSFEIDKNRSQNKSNSYHQKASV